MSTVEDGKITRLSVSQVTSFDPTQAGGCPRRWWFEQVQGLKPDQTEAQSDGEKGHALLESYFLTGEGPVGRVKMGTAVRAAIAKGELPQPGPDLLVEERFSGQPKHDASGRWIPLDVANTYWLGGVPWEGFIDLSYRRDDTPVVMDHKFLSDLNDAKPARDLIKTVQLPIYVLNQRRAYWPDAQRWEIAHHNVAKSGGQSSLVRATVSTEQVLEREAQILTVVEEMKQVAGVTVESEVPVQKKSCHAWRGCPHQARCSAFKEKPKMEMSAEELEMFGAIEATIPTPATKPEPPPPPPGAAASKPRRMKIASGSNAPVQIPYCTCGAELTPENSSKLRSGAYKHIGCPNEAAVLPPDAPVSTPDVVEAPVTASQKPVEALPLFQEPIPIVVPAGSDVAIDAPLTPTEKKEIAATVPELSGLPRALAVAEVLESIARLIRAA